MAIKVSLNKINAGESTNEVREREIKAQARMLGEMSNALDQITDEFEIRIYEHFRTDKYIVDIYSDNERDKAVIQTALNGLNWLELEDIQVHSLDSI